MSFVLDALKVSEQRRSKFARPVYAHPPRPHPGRRSRRWIAVLAAVAAVAGVFLAWRLLIPASPLPTEERPDGASPATGPAANEAAGNRPVADIADLRQTGSGASAEPSETADEPGLSGSGQPPAVNPAGAARTEPAPAALPEEQPDKIILDTVPPDWPPISLQMLFHSPQSDRSFVQVNGRSYREGERLDDGPEVLAIAPDGVILVYREAKLRLAMRR